MSTAEYTFKKYFGDFTEEDWELLVLCMIHDVYRIRYPRLDELLYKLELKERGF